MRVLAGLWTPRSPPRSLQWRLPHREDPSQLLFLPQRPVLTGGCLLDQLFFPRPLPARKLTHGELAALHTLCVDLDLGQVLERYAGLVGEHSERWAEVLSPGEQQRLAIARLCHHRPLLASELCPKIGMSFSLRRTCSHLSFSFFSYGRGDVSRGFQDGRNDLPKTTRPRHHNGQCWSSRELADHASL